MTPIYLDHAASSPLHPAAEEAMRRAARDGFANPASSHAFGRRARRLLEEARERIAHRLDAKPEEILFVSGATEANNLAVFGLAGERPGMLAAAPIEHPCVLEPLAQLEARGFRRHVLDVDAQGTVPVPAHLPEELRFVAIMLANHETGAVQPVERIVARVAGEAPILCDAAAAVGKMSVSFRRLGVDALSLSAHKFGGPVGIGGLLLRGGRKLKPMLYGGHQQGGRRPGTEAMPLAVGMAAALDAACDAMDANLERIRELRERFLQRLADALTIVVNGAQGGVPHTLNVSFPGVKGDALLIALDLAGVACSAGSACSSGSLQPSPVLRAMQLSKEVLESAVRFSIGSGTAREEVEAACDRIIHCVNRLRQDASDGSGGISSGG